MRAAIALGSNVGDRVSHLQNARAMVFEIASVRPPFLCSGLYETEPVGCSSGTRAFMNAVVEIAYDEEPAHLLTRLREIEESLGRANEHARNAPRTIDLDLLYFGRVGESSPQLSLPHPGIRSRRFVLQPLCDIQPDLVLPGECVNVRSMLADLDDSSGVVLIAREW